MILLPLLGKSVATSQGRGSGGTLVVSGTDHATITPTGRSINGFPEYTIVVKFASAIMLPAGLYWENITPCLGPARSWPPTPDN